MNEKPQPMGIAPSVPDSRKRLLAHGASILLIALGGLVTFLKDAYPHLVEVFPQAKSAAGLITAAGGAWNFILRYKEIFRAVGVEVVSVPRQEA